MRLVQATLSQLAERVLESYHQVGGINHLDGVNLPSKSVIAQITMDLLRVLFPGFFSEKPITTTLLKHETVLLMDSVCQRLESEVVKSLEYSPSAHGKNAVLATVARRLTLEFLGQLPHVRGLLQTDA